MQEAIELLEQGRDLLGQIGDAVFSQSLPPAFPSGVGSHIRHCLDFYACFLRGLDSRRIDYDRRERDESIATDRKAAIAKLDGLVRQMKGLAIADEGLPVWVRLEDASSDPQWSRSSVGRELQSLKSHTVHHYALIAALLRLHGIEPGEEFGVSISTLRNRRAA